MRPAISRPRMRTANLPPRRPAGRHLEEKLIDRVTAKVVIYEAFVEGKLEAPKHLACTVHDLYFEPKDQEFRQRTIWSLSNAFTSAFKELEPIPQFKATAKLGLFVEERFLQSFSPTRRCCRPDRHSNNQLLAPDRAVPGRGNSCSGGVKACVPINSVPTTEVTPDAAKIMPRTTN